MKRDYVYDFNVLLWLAAPQFQFDHPKKYTIIISEDLANDILSNAKKLYKRTGFNLTSDVSEFILENKNISSSDPRNNDAFNCATNSVNNG
jgi:hypothetical protein